MSATNAFEDKILTLYFINTDAANIGDAAGLQASVTAGSLYISLHTADPGETGDQTTSEAAYPAPYARIGKARSATEWTVATGTADNDNAITFAECTSGSETETDFGLGFAVSGAGSRDLNGALGSALIVTTNVQPEFAIGLLDVTLD